jgi:hypothetical protein
LLARLVDVEERDAARILAVLKRAGLVEEINERWSLARPEAGLRWVLTPVGVNTALLKDHASAMRC